MELAEPLEKVVEDRWDRDAFVAAEKQRQELEKKAVMAQRKLLNSIKEIQALANADRSDQAIEMIDKLLNDEELASQKEVLTSLRLQIIFDSSVREVEALVNKNQPEKAIQRLEELIQDEKYSQVKDAFVAMRVQILIKSNLEGADIAFGEFAEANKENGQILNDLAWEIYQKFEADHDVDMKLLRQAKKAAEYAVQVSPESGAVLDTLAHLIYVVDGDLDRAIEIQTKAVDRAIPIQRNDIKAFLDQLREEKKTGKKAKKKKATSDF